MSSSTVGLVHEYQIACICTLQTELDVVTAMLDEEHHGSPLLSNQGQNVYTFGRIGEHRIVITLTAQCGNTIAAVVTTQLVNDFPRIKFCFLVGIGGGVPSKNSDIRLGDVVVSTPEGNLGGVVQLDLGRMLSGEGLERIGTLNKPPPILTRSLYKLRSQGQQRLGEHMERHLNKMIENRPEMVQRFSSPGWDQDRLFKATYKHQGGPTCSKCQVRETELIHREPRSDTLPRVHFGTIGSGNVVVKDGEIRDRLKEEFNVLCVEMEAAGIQESFPGLIIRGISDYADSHKNDDWQPYAAAMAAAYMKTLLLSIPRRDVAHEIPAAENVQLPAAVSDRALTWEELNQILERRAANFGMTLNWRTAIVDLLKLLYQDHDSKHRDVLAERFRVTAGTSESPERNEALRKRVMEELQKNQGTIFARLGD